MSEGVNKQEIMKKLLTSEELYTLISLCNREPYVACDQETFDDEAFLFFDGEEARAKAKEMAEEKIPVGPGKLEKKQMLMFYTGLFTMGVNAVVINDGKKQLRIQLEEIVTKKTDTKLADGSQWIENPQLHLTALYYMQEFRRPPESRNQEKLSELQEEITAHFRKGRYIMALEKEKKGTPLVKGAEDVLFQPIFTDVLEFQKFNREGKFTPVIVEFAKLPEVIAKEASGVVMNVMGLNLPLTVKKENQGSTQDA